MLARHIVRRFFGSAADSSAVLNKTALYDFHVKKLGAKMVPFAGYHMPVSYPMGVLQEHLHTRNSCGLFDVSHMGQVKLQGKDVTQLLETLVVANIKDLKLDHSTLSLILNKEGGIIDDCIVTRHELFWHMVVNGANKHKDMGHFMAVIREKLPNLAGRFYLLDDLSLLALQGPKAAQVVKETLGIDTSKLGFMQSIYSIKVPKLNIMVGLSRTGYTGEDGFEISVPNVSAEKLAELLLSDERVKPIGLGARDSLRLEAGLCLHGNDIDETTNPAEAGLMWTVRKDVGVHHYVGYDALQKSIKDGIKRKRVGFMTEDNGIVRDNAELTTRSGDKKVGKCTSGTFSPILKKGVGMGYVDTASAKIGTELAANVRGKKINVKVAKMPFVPSHYYRLPEDVAKDAAKKAAAAAKK